MKKFKNKEIKAEDKDPEDAKDEAEKEEVDTIKDDIDESKAAEGASHDNKDKELAKTYDLEKAKQDKDIYELRNRFRKFLTTSQLFEPNTISLMMKPVAQFLNKENAILLMKQGLFKDSFHICISEINDF